jgi:hypothetical protein
MTSIAGKFPEDHDRLLDKLAAAAMAGGDRNGLVLAMNEWSVDFTTGHIEAIGRTGAHGFNKALDIGQEALGHIETAANGCDLNALQSLGANPEKLIAATSYGGKLYQFNMRANQALADLIVVGRDAPAVDTMLQPQDEEALQTVVFSMMQDPQVMSLMKMSMSGSADQSEMASKIDVCALGRVAIVKLKALPDDTKARIWAMGANELAKVISSGNFSRLNPAQPSMR